MLLCTNHNEGNDYMLKKFKQIYTDIHEYQIMCDANEAYNAFREEIYEYQAYKNGEEVEGIELYQQDIVILETLEKLGYPMNHIGTFLYKNVILSVLERLENVETRRDVYKCKGLIAELKDGLSPFYYNLSRRELNLGVKPFHWRIEEAISKIDNEKIDKLLFYGIFCKYNDDMDYGEQAFLIAAYVAGHMKPDILKVPKIKKLSNIEERWGIK